MMKLVTWNCRIGGFRTKAKYLATLRPDVLAVQEVEPIDYTVLFAGDCQPIFRDRRADPAYPRRAIGLFSYTDTKLKAVDESEPMYSFRRYEARRGDLLFNVVAVWPWQTKSSKTAYRQAHEGLSRHASWIGERPTVILGDFNANASFKGNNWKDLVDLLKPHGLVSAYHGYFKEAFGKETKPTHFHRGNQTAPFHLDYCFLPETWARRIKKVEVGTYADWHERSDHAPLVVDLDL
jgi:endonuclease/exonuclease/phosphatase family metal-dependent hydrolase